jgi:AraC-like DNA-binding protein
MTVQTDRPSLFNPGESGDGRIGLFQAGSSSPLGRISATDTLRMVKPNPTNRFRRFGSYALVFLLAGEGRYQDESGADRQLQPGDLILVRPSLGHFYGPYPWTEWVERYVVFEGPVFDLWEACGLFNLHPPIVRLDPVHVWNAELDRLFGDTGRIGTLPALEQVSRLQELLSRILLAHTVGGQPTSEDREWLSRAYSLLDAGDPAIGNDLDLPTVAASLAMSYDGFRKRFRNLSGISPARYRMLRRIDRAQRLLQRGMLTHREIAEALGFCDEQHFSRRFKQITGKSPRAFRQSLPISVSGARSET